MTVPSIKFQCHKCGRVKLSICSTLPEYCDCPGSGQTRREWDVGQSRPKVRKMKYPTKVRMKVVKEKR